MVDARYRRPGWFTRNVLNRGVAIAARFGISVWGSRVLQVRGRATGEIRETPVNLLSYGGESFLVSPRGETQWVRNLRVAGQGALRLGRDVRMFSSRELTDEEKPDVLRAYLRRWKMETGIFFEGIGLASPDEDVRRIAPEHPVFRIEFAV